MKKRLICLSIIGAALAIGLAYIFMPRSEKSIELVECQECSKEGCKTKYYGSGKSPTYKYIIDSKKVTVFLTGKGGAYIDEAAAPTDCKILPKEGFAFSCYTWRVTEDFKQNISFNGKDTFVKDISSNVLNYTETCSVR